MDDSINNFMVDNRIRFLENRDNNSRWCDPDVSFPMSSHEKKTTVLCQELMKKKLIRYFVLHLEWQQFRMS